RAEPYPDIELFALCAGVSYFGSAGGIFQDAGVGGCAESSVYTFHYRRGLYGITVFVAQRNETKGTGADRLHFLFGRLWIGSDYHVLLWLWVVVAYLWTADAVAVEMRAVLCEEQTQFAALFKEERGQGFA